MADNIQDEQDNILNQEADILKYESKSTYDILAKLSGQNSIDDILDVFAQKIISNLMTSAESEKEEDKRIVDLSLNVFSTYLNNN